MFKKPVFGQREIGERDAAGSNEIKPFKFEKFANTYADLNYKVFSRLVRNPEQFREELGDLVIPPFLVGCFGRIYAACLSFCAGVIPPIPMFGRSLLYDHSQRVACS